MPILECKNVTLKYEHITILEDISFQLRAGEFLCVVGENGSGKTTLMRAILGLKSVSGGEIIFDSEETKKGIGYLPQTAEIQKDFPASAFEVVLSGCMNEKILQPRATRQQKELALHNMERLGVEGLKNKSFRVLSGGQQQRVLLARALCHAKNLLVLDEPVSRLDPIAGRKMYELISKINKEMGIAVVMVSHDVENAARYADFILHLCNNKMCLHTAREYASTDLGISFIGGHRHE